MEKWDEGIIATQTAYRKKERTKGRERGVWGETESVCEEKKCEKQDRGERVREGSEREW